MMRIAVGFDGVIVDNKYPEIGDEIPDAIKILKKLQDSGHQIILWTHRIGTELKAAVNYCQEKDLIFFAVNANYPGEIFTEGFSRKIRADLYLESNFLNSSPKWEELFWFLYLMNHK